MAIEYDLNDFEIVIQRKCDCKLPPPINEDGSRAPLQICRCCFGTGVEKKLIKLSELKALLNG